MTPYVVFLTLLFVVPLTRLMLYAAGTDIHSHIVLVPAIAGYLLYERRGSLPGRGTRSMPAVLALVTLGIAAVAAAAVWRGSLSVNDHHALMAVGYISLIAAGGFFFQGARWMAAAAFSMALLVFLIPLPDRVVDALERASMVASAEAAAWYFHLAGTPLVRHGTVFELPGITLQVAQECSGIRSSWVLFITSVLASNMFLKTGWRRVLLVAFVIPLGILRNGFRVFVLGILSVHVGPHILDTAIHHRGGPLFFALSLGPLFALLWWLRRGERRHGAGTTAIAQREPAA